MEHIDPNQSCDFYPTVQLIWIADKVSVQYDVVVNDVYIFSRTILQYCTNHTAQTEKIKNCSMMQIVKSTTGNGDDDAWKKRGHNIYK